LETRLQELEGALEGLGNIPFPVEDQRSHPFVAPAQTSTSESKSGEIAKLESTIRTLQGELSSSGAMIQFLGEKMADLEREVFGRR